MSYTAPPLSQAVVLEDGYTPPPLSEPVVLGTAQTTGTVAVTIPPAEVSAVSLAAVGMSSPAQSRSIAVAAQLPPVVLAPVVVTGQGIISDRALPGALRFVRPTTPTPGPVALVFSRGVAPAGAVVVSAALGATLPAVDVSPLGCSAAVVQDLDLPAADGPGIRAPARDRDDEAAPLSVAQQQMQSARTPIAAAHQQAAPLPAACASRQRQMLPAARAARARHQHALPLGNAAAARHADTLRSARHLRADYQHGQRRAVGVMLQHAERIRLRRRGRLDHHPGAPARAGARIGHHHGAALVRSLRLPQQQARPLPVGWWQATYPWPEPTSPYSSPVALRFCHAADGSRHLVFGCRAPAAPGHTVIVPIREVYIVVNNVSLMRVSNSLAIPALTLQVSIDADSWGWGWSSSVPASQLENLLPDGPQSPIELEAQVNGVVWRLLVERIARDRRFGKDRLAVSGRGIAAELADPLYPSESRDNLAGALTAQQLAAAALSTNGVSLGWTLDWQIPDWLVPAGAWVHTGTPMDAVTRIAAAAGGYVQADPLARTLHVLKRYPLLPWEWAAATPDYILPSSATTREATEYIERPNYNLVYVAGSAVGGVLGQVKRAGTAGDLPAEMVVDALVTHADAARGRGSAILGDTGSQQMLTLETPILEEIGLYPVGALIEWQEGAATRRGLVRSVAVNVQRPKVRQTIEVECHG